MLALALAVLALALSATLAFRPKVEVLQRFNSENCQKASQDCYATKVVVLHCYQNISTVSRLDCPPDREAKRKPGFRRIGSGPARHNAFKGCSFNAALRCFEPLHQGPSGLAAVQPKLRQGAFTRLSKHIISSLSEVQSFAQAISVHWLH